MRWFASLALALALGVMGCGDDPATCPVPSGTCQYNGDNLVRCEVDQQCDEAEGFVCLLDSGEPATDGTGDICAKPLGNVAECTDGETRCADDKVETCQGGEWAVTATCDQDQLCNDLGDVAQCVEKPCTDGETRCADDKVETCNALGVWSATATCSDGCEVVNDEAMCIVVGDLCTADNLLDQRCNPDDELWIQECRNTGTTEAPVYEWVNVQDCSTLTPDYVCQGGDSPFCFLSPT